VKRVEGPLDGAIAGNANAQQPALQRKASFVGTAEYSSPELLNDRIVSPASDIWALGIILFYLVTGDLPFKGLTEYQTFQAILSGDYSLYKMDEAPDAKSLVEAILVPSPDDRITGLDMGDHPFLAQMPWGDALDGMDSPLQALMTALPPRKESVDSEDFPYGPKLGGRNDSEFDLPPVQGVSEDVGQAATKRDSHGRRRASVSSARSLHGWGSGGAGRVSSIPSPGRTVYPEHPEHPEHDEENAVAPATASDPVVPPLTSPIVTSGMPEYAVPALSAQPVSKPRKWRCAVM
jgi:serine/threonine protein kinase